MMWRALLVAGLVFWVVGIGPLCWLLRDGLGPNSVDSHGWHAIVRFLLTFYWGPVTAVLMLLTLYAMVWSHRSKRDDEEPC